MVVATGAVKVYSPRGQYQIDCLRLDPLGQGELFLAFEALKAQLDPSGLFQTPPTSKHSRLFPLPLVLLPPPLVQQSGISSPHWSGGCLHVQSLLRLLECKGIVHLEKLFERSKPSIVSPWGNSHRS